MSPAKQAKAAGLESLTEASRISGRRLQTLHKWAKEKPDFFAVVLAGCASIKRQKETAAK